MAFFQSFHPRPPHIVRRARYSQLRIAISSTVKIPLFERTVASKRTENHIEQGKQWPSSLTLAKLRLCSS
jgi:hypothetical protein